MQKRRANGRSQERLRTMTGVPSPTHRVLLNTVTDGSPEQAQTERTVARGMATVTHQERRKKRNTWGVGILGSAYASWPIHRALSLGGRRTRPGRGQQGAALTPICRGVLAEVCVKLEEALQGTPSKKIYGLIVPVLARKSRRFCGSGEKSRIGKDSTSAARVLCFPLLCVSAPLREAGCRPKFTAT